MLFAVLAGVVTSGAELSVQDLPPIVHADIEYSREMCRALGQPMQLDEAFFEQADFNQDGTPDYLFDVRGVYCGKDNAALFNSREGTPLYMYLSNEKGEWDKVFNAYIFEYQIKKDYGQAPTLDVWVRGEVGYQVVFQRHQWNGEKMMVIDQEIGTEVPEQLWKKFD